MRFYYFLFSVFFSLVFSAQEKIFFSKSGKAASADEAFYYRKKTGNTDYKSYYVNGDAIYFEGSILYADNNDEALNKYNGNCIWYFKNGNKKMVKTFDVNGQENGLSIYYYESGKIWKEVEIKNGKPVNSKYVEYNEDGSKQSIFEEEFDNNSNDWDLYTSDKSISKITDGKFELTSLTKEGSARYINFGSIKENTIIEGIINTTKLNDGQKAGLIFGFKDWNNYNFFLIAGTSMYIGSVYEGITILRVEGMFASSIIKNGKNSLKILVGDDKVIYSVNGELQYTLDEIKSYGSNLGFLVTGKGLITVDKLLLKETQSYNTNTSTSKTDENIKSTGSGVIVSKLGHIITNYHVINDATKIFIELTKNDITKQYIAQVIQKDKDNDLAILKITDESFTPFEKINYGFKESGGLDVGASVFTMGFPLALSGMGKAAKYTDGKVSSKTGYDGAINSFQTTIPVQPGNSGGPVFNNDGFLVGVINAAITDADNVSYGIKLNYIKNLMEIVGDIEMPNSKDLQQLSTEEKIKIISNYVVLIKVK